MLLDEIFRKLPLFRGKQRVARFLYKKKIGNEKNINFTGHYGCKYIIPNLKENIGLELFINGVYEKETIDRIIKNIPVNGTLLDIGANIGAISIPISKLRTDIHIVAVEASNKVYNYLKENVALNKMSNCEIVNNAISDTDGQTVSFFSPDELFGKGSMAAVFTDAAENVETITLDTLILNKGIEKVDLIKIDVEGFEYLAFKGGVKLLTHPNAPDILFEFVDWAEELAGNIKPGDAQKILIEYGYSLWEIKSNNELEIISKPLIKGSIMIWASKKK